MGTRGASEAEAAVQEHRAVPERMATGAPGAALVAGLVERSTPAGACQAPHLEAVAAAARRIPLPMPVPVARGGMGKSESRGPAGLIGYWNFDEDSGTIAHDTSGSGYNGVVSGATWTTGKINSALTFNGTTNDVITPNIALGNTFSA